MGPSAGIRRPLHGMACALWALAVWNAVVVAAAGVGGSARPQAADGAPCKVVESELQAAGVWLLGGLADDGPDHCAATVQFPVPLETAVGTAAQAAAAAATGATWTACVRLSRRALQDALRGAGRKGAAAAGNPWQGDPQAAAMRLTNLLCMPRLTMLWSLVWHARSAHGAGHGGQLRPGHAQAAAADSSSGTGPAAAADQLALLQLTQQLLAAASQPGAPSVRAGLPGALRAAGLARGQAAAAPLQGSGWGAWLMWAVAPGLLVAHWAVAEGSHQPAPWFTLYVCSIGLLRTFFELFALRMALSRGRLSRTDKLDSWFCSHVLPAGLNGLLAGLQALISPFMPAPMSQTVFWLRCLLLPPISLWVLFSSWVPLDDLPGPAHGGGGLLAGRQAGRSERRLQRGQDGGADGGGAARQAPSIHWPPPLEVPAEVEDLPPEQVPEAFRCPITLGIMHEPTQSTSGITFERAAIQQWLEGHRHDPVTHAPLRRRHLSPNLALRVLMEAWVAERAAGAAGGLAGGGAAAAAGVAVAGASEGVRPSTGEQQRGKQKEQ